MNTYEITREDEVIIRRTWYDVEARTKEEALDKVGGDNDFDDSEEIDWNEGTPEITDTTFGTDSYTVNATVNVEASSMEFADEATKKALSTLEGYTDNRGENTFEITLTTVNSTQLTEY